MKLEKNEGEKMPESTFSMVSKNQAEKSARDNVELPYFIGEKDEPTIDKSK